MCPHTVWGATPWQAPCAAGECECDTSLEDNSKTEFYLKSDAFISPFFLASTKPSQSIVHKEALITRSAEV